MALIIQGRAATIDQPRFPVCLVVGAIVSAAAGFVAHPNPVPTNGDDGVCDAGAAADDDDA